MAHFTLIAKPGEQEFSITCELNARREAVFQALTDPTLIPKWWGPRKYATIVDKLEARPGGMWRFINRAADGTDFGFHGVIHAITAPERIVQTFEFEGAAGHVALETLTLEDRGGKTLLTDHSVFQSGADRDGMIQEGMEEGARESYERLEELAREL